LAFVDQRERKILESVATLADGNPFLEGRLSAEQRVLGDAFVQTGAAVWHADAESGASSPNVGRLHDLFESMTPTLRGRLVEGTTASAEELRLYQQLVFYLLYQRHEGAWQQLIDTGEKERSTTGRVPAYRRFREDLDYFLALPERAFPESVSAPHLFALGFQLRRAFHHIFRQIYGGSLPAASLRATVWEAIFTHDGARYRRAIYGRLADVPTLVTGESGTGKELVAQAIALSRYIAFDEDGQCFTSDYREGFFALNLSALSPNLVESELFGHRRGAFTGAIDDRRGWLEGCPREGCVFLDEIGELDSSIQVKLLRVLQSRTFQRIGESKTRRFEGKILAATNRDLAEEMRAGRFRTDFYYRLCADVIRTPTLREQVADRPEELRDLATVLARRLVGDDEAERLATETTTFIRDQLGSRYPWPGNVRELEQCVRSVLIRGRYSPPEDSGDALEDLRSIFRDGSVSADELLRRYCTHVYASVGSYEETARRLGIDRRTVKARIDPELLETLRRPASE
jgi:transcriptional regulator with AAA-type ATPase domain